jgi:hypothetical protein
MFESKVMAGALFIVWVNDFSQHALIGRGEVSFIGATNIVLTLPI